MARRFVFASLALAGLSSAVYADDPMAGPPPPPPPPPLAPAVPAAPAPAAPAAPVPTPAPQRASDEDAAKALATFREAWKAKGLKGDERLSQRDWALDEVSKVQHPLVAAELGSVARSGDGDLRLMAVIYLARQKAIPGIAGEQVLQALQRAPKDVALVLSALQSLGKLKYLGAGAELRDLLKSEDWAVRKGAITTVGRVGDMRMLEDLLKILGVDVKNAAPPPPADDKKGGKEVVEEGYSWEGAEAVVDHGDSDNSKENAEAKAQAEAQMAKNKAEAGAGKSSGGGGDGPAGAGGTSGTGGRGGSGRNPSELKPYALKALKMLTGETFTSSRDIYLWVSKNGATVATKKKECDANEAVQKAEPKK